VHCMEDQSVVGLCDKEAFDSAGRYLGVVEAVGMGRDRVPRRVGVRSGLGGPPPTFFSLAGATFEGNRVVLAVPNGSGQP
jgi:hypothetical protein